MSAVEYLKKIINYKICNMLILVSLHNILFPKESAHNNSKKIATK